MALHDVGCSYRHQRWFLVLAVSVCMAVLTRGGIAAEDPNESMALAKPFVLIAPHNEIDDAIVGQRCVFPVTVLDEGEGVGGGDPVKLSAVLLGLPGEAKVSVEPNSIGAGEVAELTMIPREPNDVDPNDRILVADGPDFGPVDPGDEDQERDVVVEIVAERGGVRRSRLIEVNVLPGEDMLGETAAFYRDLFVPWLAEQHPELGITEETEWVGTVVRPHILVVTYYLYYSAEWEMGVRWHVMIPPYDWAEIYLRRRSELSSTRAWRIDGVAGELEPRVTGLPTEGVFR